MVDRSAAGRWFREYCSNLKTVQGEQQPHHHSYRSRSPRLSQREWEEKQKAENKKKSKEKEEEDKKMKENNKKSTIVYNQVVQNIVQNNVQTTI